MTGNLSSVNRFLMFSVLFTVCLYYGRDILIPVVFAIMLAMLMVPVCNKLDGWGTHRSISSFVCVFILFIALMLILAVVAAQIAAFSEDMPQIKEKAGRFMEKVQQFISEKFGVREHKQKEYFSKSLETMGKSAGNYFGIFIGGLAGVIANIIITLVITYLFLFGKERYQKFFLKLYNDNDTSKVKKVLDDISHISQKYLLGRVISMLLLAVFYSVGLLIVGIQNAVLLGCLAALLTIVPYIGPLLGGVFPLIMALITENSLEPALWVVVVMAGAQAFDNYFVEPYVVGGEVNLSALATILAIIIGGLIWGPVGMILFIPILGIAKIVFDQVEKLRPYGYLIGDPDGASESDLKKRISGWFKKDKKG